MDEFYQHIIEVLERRYFQQPVPTAHIIQHALANPAFTRYWLCHAIASDAEKAELATVLAIAAHQQQPELTTLLQIWRISPMASEQTQTDFLQQLSSIAPTLMSGIVANTGQSALNLQTLAHLWQQLCQQRHISSTNNLELVAKPLPIDACWLKTIPDVLQNCFEKAGVYGLESSADRHLDIRDCGQYINALPQNNIVMASLERMVAFASAQSLLYAEPLVILRYLPGEQFKWHCDFISSTHAQAQDEMMMFGQRCHTTISYLNDDFTGGITEFKHWEQQITPKQGMMISFANVTADGKPNSASLHRSTPVLSGIKFVATSWYRAKPLWHRAGLISDVT